MTDQKWWYVPNFPIRRAARLSSERIEALLDTHAARSYSFSGRTEIRQKMPEDAGNPRDGAPAAQGAVKVLLVEDSSTDAESILRTLRSIPEQKFIVETEQTVHGARKALAGTFDICLMDFFLGDGDAIDLLSEIDPVALPGPILLLTGQVPPEVIEGATAVGITDYLFKDLIEPEVLRRAIRYSLQHHQDRRRQQHSAEHAPITGLLLHRAFRDRLGALLAKLSASRSKIWVGRIDLLNFGELNHARGYAVGDLILLHVRSALRDLAGPNALLSHFGGGQFAFAMQNLPADSARPVLETLSEAISGPVVSVGGDYRCSARIGAVSAEVVAGDGSAVLAEAERALAMAGAGRPLVLRTELQAKTV